MFYFPHAIGSAHAALRLGTSWSHLAHINVILAIATVFVRGAECAWNDLVDAPLDSLVERTRHRPVARGAISSFSASLCRAVNAAIAAACLILLPPETSLVVLPAVGFWVIYPFCKRFTNFPQVPLAVVQGWGVIIGATATGGF